MLLLSTQTLYASSEKVHLQIITHDGIMGDMSGYVIEEKTYLQITL